MADASVQYKIIDQLGGPGRKGHADLERELNEAAKDGWRYEDSIALGEQAFIIMKR
jgi:hypothetical protein